MADLAFTSIKKLHERIQRKELSKKEVLGYFLDRIKRYDDFIGSTLEVFDESSITSQSNEDSSGPLSGIPGLLKDNMCQKGRITSAASKMLEQYRAPYDSTVSKRLKDAGAFLVGRANCDEFAMGSSNENSAYKVTRNPWDRSRVPGGSSGGSAAAVAAGFVPWALGSDTGGSIRQPAALCGVVGLKPTYGLVSRNGLIAYGSSLDTIGPLTRTVEDAAYVLSAIAGNDKNDSSSLDVPQKDYTVGLSGKIKEGCTIGIIENAMTAEGIDDDVQSALGHAIMQLKALGATVKHIRLSSMGYSAATYFIVSRAEAASNLARFDGVRYGLRVPADSLSSMYLNTRHEGFGIEVRRRIMVGNYALAVGHAEEFYNNALKSRRMMRAEFEDALKDVDMLFLPVSGSGAFEFGAYAGHGIQLDLQDYFTAPANLTGLPAISVPCGFTKDKLPVAFQLMGPRLSEEMLLQTAYAYEQETKWYEQYPHFA